MRYESDKNWGASNYCRKEPSNRNYFLNTNSSIQATSINDQYLNLMNQPPFIIKVNNKEYKCNPIGVNSSKVIQEFRRNNPNLNQYEFNIDNQNDEFQIICDIFNLKKVQLTTKNMNTLLRICDELQIEIFLDKITKFSDLYESIIQESETIDDIFAWLYQIQTLTVEAVKNSILDSIWIQNFENIQELVAIFLQVIRTTSYQNQIYLIELIILLDQSSNEVSQLKQFLPFFNDKIKSIFFNSKLYCSFIYKMSQKGLISINEIIDIICLLDPVFSEVKSNNNSNNNNNKNQSIEIPLENFRTNHHKNVAVWFFPELYEMKNFSIDKILKFLNKFEIGLIQKYLPEKIDQFKQIRDSLEPDNEIEKSILNDDVDNLQKIILNNRINCNNATISNSILNVFDPSISKSLINYSAECGSIKCFKFLLLNHAEIDKHTYGFAIYGGNTEIIRIVDQKRSNIKDNQKKQKNQSNNNNNNNNYYGYGYCKSNSNKNYGEFDNLFSFFDVDNLINPIKLTIIMHKYDLFDWMFEKHLKYIANTDFLNDYARISIQNGNTHSFIQLLDNGLILNKNVDLTNELIKMASILGFYKFARLLGYFVGPISIPIFAPLVFGNLSIFQLYYTKDVSNIELDLLLTVAVKKNYLNIIQYIIENLNYQENLKSFKFIETAYSLKNSMILNYFEEKFNLDNLKNIYKFDINQFRTLLREACLSGNIETVKKVTDFIIKNYPEESFTNQFITAGSSGNEEICQYFIDKKVTLDIKAILHNYKTLASKIGKIIISFLNSVDIKTKEEYSNFFLNEAIFKGNANLVETLLNKEALDDQALFNAVKGRNVEIVNKILQFNNKPSFINQLSPNGTALNIAVSNNDISIVNILLSLKGIDPSLRNNNGMTPLISAIINYNLRLVNCILDFYGDSIHEQSWQIKKALKIIMRKIQDSQSSIVSIYPIIDRLVLNKNIDLNFYIRSRTLLVYACQMNDKKLVEILLKSETIDVNLYDIKTSDSPLIISINSKNFEIADLLLGHPNININYKNNNFQTALTTAAKCDFEKIIPYIIHHEKFNPDESCLNYAFFISHGQIAKDLYQVKELNVNYKTVQNGDFMTCLDKSLFVDDEEKLEMIITHPSFDSSESFTNETIFNSMIVNNFQLLKKILKIAHRDINMISSDGDSLFVYCAKNEFFDTMKQIFNDEDFKLTKDDFISAFLVLFSAKIGQAPIDLMNQLIQLDENKNHFIDFNELLSDGRSFYTSTFVLLTNVDQVVQFFLNHNVDPNKPDLNGVYPLEYAIKNESLPFVVTLLQSNKIDFSVKLKDNETYVHLAEVCYNNDISKEFIDRKLIDPDSKEYVQHRKNIQKLTQKSTMIKRIIDFSRNSGYNITIPLIVNNYELFEKFYDKFDFKSNPIEYYGYVHNSDSDSDSSQDEEFTQRKLFRFCEKFYQFISEHRYYSANKDNENEIDDIFIENLYMVTEGTVFQITEDLIITNLKLFASLANGLNANFYQDDVEKLMHFSVEFYHKAIKNIPIDY